jgi:hypothetical protein
VTRHDDPLVFLAAARAAYAKDPATESQYAAQAYVLVQHPAAAADRIHLATCAEGAAVQRGDGPALIGSSTPQAAMLLADDLADDWPQLQGVVGSVEGCLAFARRWRERTPPAPAVAAAAPAPAHRRPAAAGGARTPAGGGRRRRGVDRRGATRLHRRDRRVRPARRRAGHRAAPGRGR